MPFIFCSNAFPPWRYSFLLPENSGGCALRNAMQNFSKEFSSAPPSPPRKWLLSRLFTRQPFLTFLYLPFSFFLFFFSQLATWFHVLIFHVSFLAPISTGFSSRRGVNDFFFPSLSSSKMEGIKTRHFNAPSWPTFAKWWFREKCRALRKKKGEDFG